MNKLVPFIIKEGSRMTPLNNGHLKVYEVIKDFDVIEQLEEAGLKVDDVTDEGDKVQVAKETLQTHLIENGLIKLKTMETTKPPLRCIVYRNEVSFIMFRGMWLVATHFIPPRCRTGRLFALFDPHLVNKK